MMISSWRDLKALPLSPTASAFLENSRIRRVGGWVRQRHVYLAIFLSLTSVFLLLHLLSDSFSTSSSPSHFGGNFPVLPSPFEASNGTFRYIPPLQQQSVGVTGKRARYAKVSLISGFEDVVYERAMHTHVRHAHRHGYPIYIARQEAAPGMFNKVAFILNILMSELYKAPEERVDWLFYFDADSIIMNEELPLEIFDTPEDYRNINWIAAKDWNGLNAGVFILRVCPWSVDLLTRVMTHKHYHPNEDYTFEEQSILSRLTERDERFKSASIYVPKTWINSYFYLNGDVIPGSLIAHFPHPDYKWHIYTWLRAVNDDLALLEGKPAPEHVKLEPPEEGSKPTKDRGNPPPVSGDGKPIYHIPVDKTVYPAQIKKFWEAKRRYDHAAKGFLRNIQRKADPIDFGMKYPETKVLATKFKEVYDEFKSLGPLLTDKPKELIDLIERAEQANAALITGLMEYFETHDNPPNLAGF